MKMLATMAMTLALCACSSGDTPAPAPQGAVSKDNAFSADVDALARAKQADRKVQDAAEQQRQAIEADQ